jgi:hypothetical protein
VDSVHGPWITPGCPVHHGPALAARTIGHWDMTARSLELACGRSVARKLIGGGRGRRGEGGKPVMRLTQTSEGVMQQGDGSVEAAWWHLVEAALERGEGRRRAGRGAVEDGGGSPFYRGQRG